MKMTNSTNQQKTDCIKVPKKVEKKSPALKKKTLTFL